MNYTVEEYAADVVHAFKMACDRAGAPHPTIISESGRAVCSHQSVLVFNVLGSTSPAHCVQNDLSEKPDEGSHQLITSLYETLNSIDQGNLQEWYHDAVQFRKEAQTLFNMGMMTLTDRATTEELYWRCLSKLYPLSKNLKSVPEELYELERDLAHIYYCNFSVFRSAPDTWAISQRFPIMPLHRHNERPTECCVLADITCDSDGKVDQFIDHEEEYKELLQVHSLKKEEPYYIGMFLHGAYQEVLGNLHNLFGDTNVVHVTVDPDDFRAVTIEHVIKGKSTDKVLESMNYTPRTMLDSMRQQAEQALKSKSVTLPQYKTLLKHYEKALTKYTYLWAED
jgi:arginine decarboxylase